jgi:hypothetical protein
MIRALLFAFGLVGTLFGAALFYIDTIQLKLIASETAAFYLRPLCSIGTSGALILNPAEWLPYTIVGMSGLTVLYSIALPPVTRRYADYGHGGH